jgi:2-haloacid dehalogenase
MDKSLFRAAIARQVSNTVRDGKFPCVRHDAPAPRAVLFDAYGTLFDVYSVAQLAEQLFPGRGQALSLLWRDKQIEYTRLVTTSRRYGQLGTPDISPPFYRPFGELTRAASVYAIKK